MARRTALYERHRALGARIVDFAGWEMPVSYRGALEEHRAVRERCGLFDVSHMGEVEVRGGGAVAWCDGLTVNEVHRLGDGEAQYSVLCDERGGVIDDLIVSRLGPERVLLVVNASNTSVDLAWMREHARPGVEILDRSDETGLLALQGPKAAGVLERLGVGGLAGMRPFTVRQLEVAGRAVLLSRTGYTGEDGFELFVGVADAEVLWDALLGAMEPEDGLPCGLAARDSLRLEAALPLHGSDMDRTTTPLEAGLGWVVKLGKADFVGKAALAAQHERGPARRLVGLEMDEPGVPRHGQVVSADGASIGTITSGTKSPTLDRFIAMAYVDAAHARSGAPVKVDMRGRQHAAHVVQRPFYRRPR